MRHLLSMRRTTRVPGCLFAALLLVGVVAACSAGEPAARHNVILISIDTLRADHVGAYGYLLPTTPEIDALARDSLRLSSCVAHAPMTLASHASILTSLLPRHHGASIARTTRLADGATTLAEVLDSHGYATASFNGGVQLDAAYGLDRGFDVYESAKPSDAKPETLAGDEDRLRHGVERTIEWLSETPSPFFVFLHSYEIHHPYTPDAETLALFDSDYAGPLPDHISVELLERINAGEQTLSEADLAHVVHTYDAELRSADAAVGRLVAYLKRTDRYDDTLIVLTSDHGEEFGDHGQVGWHAHTLYDELLLVPLIIKFPGSQLAGVVDAAQARGIDVAPTVLAALGIDAPEGFAGRDLAAAKAAGDAVRPAISMHDVPGDAPLFAVRAGRWKLRRVGAEKLFDLVADPSEQTNVANRFPQRAAELRRQGFRLLEEREKPEDVAAVLRTETEQQLRELGYLVE